MSPGRHLPGIIEHAATVCPRVAAHAPDDLRSPFGADEQQDGSSELGAWHVVGGVTDDDSAGPGEPPGPFSHALSRICRPRDSQASLVWRQRRGGLASGGPAACRAGGATDRFGGLIRGGGLSRPGGTTLQTKVGSSSRLVA